MFKKLGFTIAKHPIITLISWVIATAIVGALAFTGFGSESLFDRLSTSEPGTSGEASHADDILTKWNNGAYSASSKDHVDTESVFLIVQNTSVENEAVRNQIEKLNKTLDKFPNVESVTSPALIPFDQLEYTPLKDFVNNTDTGFVTVISVKKGDKETLNEVIKLVEESAPDFESVGATTQIANETLISDQISGQAVEDLKKGELLSLPLALLVLVIVFAGFLAAATPLIGAVVSIIAGLGVLWGASWVMEVDTTVLNVLTVIGLGLSIDYGLLMVSRFRETLRNKPWASKRTISLAVADTLDTAGRTVVFSGLIVALCAGSIFMLDISIMKSIAVSAAGVILMAILTSLTLLPALFTLFGKRLVSTTGPLTKIPGLGKILTKFGDTAPKEGVFSKISDFIQKAPKTIFVAGVALLLFLGSSVLTLHVSNYGTPYLANGSSQTKAFDYLTDEIPAFQKYDITIVVDPNKAAVNEANTSIREIKNWLHDQDNIQTVELHKQGTTIDNETSPYLTLTANVINKKEGQSVVSSLRTHIEEMGGGGTYYVTGNAAKDVDFNEKLMENIWLVVGFIIIVTFIILFLMTGSLFIPIKAILLSALSLGASIGVLTWGFEGGGLSGILNFDPDSILGLSPLILVIVTVFGFALATDYEIFLISRMQEEYKKHGDPQKAIRNGLQGSGRIITSAGLAIMLVFLGFTAGEMLMIKQVGVALATAILVDMVIVRCVLVPAIMTVFGKTAWWAPKSLTKIYERFSIKH